MVESTFFSQPTQKKMLASLSDGYFCFSEEDIKTINKRLNYHPNFFGIHFDTSVSCLSSDISDNWYIKIDSRRAA